MRLARPGDRQRVDHYVVALEQVEQGHDVVEGEIGVEHDVPDILAPRRRLGRGVPGARGREGDAGDDGDEPSHGPSLGRGGTASRREGIIAMSRHVPRQKLALEFGATDIVEERGDGGVAKIKELTAGSTHTR